MPYILSIFEPLDISSYIIKLTRDAELDLDDDFSASYYEKVTKSVSNRKKGKVVRFVYDREMPETQLDYIISNIKLSSSTNLIPGGRYHNFRDFMGFPNLGREDLCYAELPSIEHHSLNKKRPLLKQISESDILLQMPYHSFDIIIDIIREASIDPKVECIKMSLYRVAPKSKIIKALKNAARNGKQVYVVIELRARFDEEANIYWTDKLRDGGVNVDFGIWDFKVHSKICLVTRLEKRKKVYYANLSTGNFNEKTAKLYCDHSLFTANQLITNEVQRVFTGLLKKTFYKDYKQLIVSPLESRKKLFHLIDSEITYAKKGKEAYIILKMNSLTDPKIIEKLYQASQAGVKIELIIRGMCSLLPGIKGYSENISIISIIDRYLEHARVWIFGNKGDEKIYLSSADLMTRNLDHRLEVGFPILDPYIKLQIRDIIDLQLRDNTKARIIQPNGLSPRKKPKKNNTFRAQTDTYTYLKNL